MKKVNGEFTRTSLGHIPHRLINVNGIVVLAPVKILSRESDGKLGKIPSEYHDGPPAPMRSGTDLIYALPGGGEVILPAPEDIKYRKPGEFLC